MATTTFSCTASMATDAAFRAWASAIDTALTTVGLVNTSDTGQINLTTVVLPGSNSTAAGYKIYRFNDTAQSTYPLFLKVEFGSNGFTTVASGCPGMWLTIGKGTDGAGNLTGVLIARRQLHSSYTSTGNTGSASSFSGVASGGDNWVALVPWLNANGSVNGLGGQGFHTPFFTIERLNSGASIAVCTSIAITNTVANGLSTVTGTTGPPLDTVNYATGAIISGYVPVLLPGTVGGTRLGPTTSLAAGAIGPVFPWVVVPPGLAPDQCVNTLSYPAGDTPSTTFTATLNGVTRTYNPIPLSDAHNSFGFSFVQQVNLTNDINRYVGLCIRWD